MGSCSVSQISSAVTGPRAAVNACIARHVVAQSVRPRCRMIHGDCAEPAAGCVESTTGATA